MEVPKSDLELLQSVIDNRLGGNIELAAQGLALIERELVRAGIMSMFEKVGNNCLVFFTNDRAKKVCDENRETIKGVIVGDYDCWIHPEAVVIGSYMQGSVNSPARVDFGSKVYYSDIVMARVRRSEVTKSYVSIGTVNDSIINESFTSGDLRYMNLARSMARVGAISEVTATGQLLGYDRRRDEPDTDGLVAHMLARRGLYASAVPVIEQAPN